MRGKFRKIFNFRNIIVGLIIVVMAAVSGISIVQYNSKNVETNLGKATVTTNTNWNPGGIDVTAEEIVKQALTLAVDNKSDTYSEGCIGFLNTVIETVNNESLNTNTTNLIENCATWGKGTITGTSIDSRVLKYTTNANMTNGGKKWFDEIGASNLQPGDIIVGNGHAMIYLGTVEYYNYNEKSELKENKYSNLAYGLKKKYGIDISTLPSSWGTELSSFYRDYTNTEGHENRGSKYWVIDVNGNGNHARIQDYDWTVAEGNSKNLNNMRLYRFYREGKINIGAIKTSDDNKSLSGAKIQMQQKINGTWKDINEVVCDDGNSNNYGLLYESTLRRPSMTNVYRIKEIVAPTGYEIGYSGWIYFRIYIVQVNGKVQIKGIDIGSAEDKYDNYYDLPNPDLESGLSEDLFERQNTTSGTSRY